MVFFEERESVIPEKEPIFPAHMQPVEVTSLPPYPAELELVCKWSAYQGSMS
jgi:hypothetical protein